MRITTNMIMRNYRGNLNSTLVNLERTRRQVETGRRIANAYEDPAAASRGAILEQRYSRTQDYINSAENAQKWLDSQEDVLNGLNTIAVAVREDYSPSALTDTSGKAGRDAYASTIREMQKSMLNALNTKYGDAYVMAGSDGRKPPFTQDDNGNIFFRGINVSTGEGDGITSTVTAEEGKKLLAQYAKDTTYIDLGFGLAFEDNGNVMSASAFDTALPGINAVGFGEDDEGLSNNLMDLMNRMAELLEYDEEAGEVFNREEYEKVWDRFSEKADELQTQFTKIGAKSQQLTTTISKLKTESTNIEEQYKDALGIDEAKAISDYSYANYVYNAALKVGTSILTPSLLDFMK